MTAQAANIGTFLLAESEPMFHKHHATLNIQWKTEKEVIGSENCYAVAYGHVMDY
jgi:hypothetical protein